MILQGGTDPADLVAILPMLPLLAVALVLSFFFSASESALFSLRRSDLERISERKDGAARAVRDLLEQPHALLVTVLFGNVLVNTFFFTLSEQLGEALAARHGPWALGAVGASSVVVVILFGELTPKSVAVTVPLKLALLAARPLRLFRDVTWILTAPLERLVSWSLDVFTRRLSRRTPLSGDELRRLVEAEGKAGLLERRASELLADVIELRERRVKEVMTPRVDVVAFDVTEGREGFLDLVRMSRHGKFPVHDGGGLDRIFGVLRARDVLRAAAKEDLRASVEPAWFVPETKTLVSLLKEMVDRNRTIAVAVDEHGGTAGLVTLEDVVEEVVGDIASPLDLPLARPAEDGSMVLSGRIGLREAGDLLGVRFPVLGPTTLSGLIVARLGRIPDVGDEISVDGCRLRVTAVARRRATEVVAVAGAPASRAPGAGP